jgi:hypothetical protein
MRVFSPLVEEEGKKEKKHHNVMLGENQDLTITNGIRRIHAPVCRARLRKGAHRCWSGHLSDHIVRAGGRCDQASTAQDPTPWAQTQIERA